MTPLIPDEIRRKISYNFVSECFGAPAPMRRYEAVNTLYSEEIISYISFVMTMSSILLVNKFICILHT